MINGDVDFFFYDKCLRGEMCTCLLCLSALRLSSKLLVTKCSGVVLQIAELGILLLLRMLRP